MRKDREEGQVRGGEKGGQDRGEGGGKERQELPQTAGESGILGFGQVAPRTCGSPFLP